MDDLLREPEPFKISLDAMSVLENLKSLKLSSIQQSSSKEEIALFRMFFLITNSKIKSNADLDEMINYFSSDVCKL